MKRKTIIALMIGVGVAVACFLLAAHAPKVQAQQNCPSLHVLIHAKLLVPELLLREGDVWGGYAHGYLGQEALHGRYSGNNGATVGHGRVGMGRGSDYFDFGGERPVKVFENAREQRRQGDFMSPRIIRNRLFVRSRQHIQKKGPG